MDKQNLSELLREVIHLTKEVGAYIFEESNNFNPQDIEEKEVNSLVTYVDKTAEEKLVNKLSSLTPKASFITEEDTVQTTDSRLKWIIDPLDGTTNYLFKLPHYSTSIALEVEGEIVLGVVNDIARKECFHAIKSQGAFLNNRLLHLPKKLTLKDSLFVTGFPYTNDYQTEAMFKIINHWLKNSRGLRRLGSAALDLCYVASSRVSCYYEGFLNVWDIAAGQLIASEAGFTISDFKGNDDYLTKGEVIGCNPHIYQEVLEVIKSNYEK